MTLPYSASPVERALQATRGAGYDFVAWGVNQKDPAGQSRPVIAVEDRLTVIRFHDDRLPLQPGEMDRAWIALCTKVLSRASNGELQAACHFEIARRLRGLARIGLREKRWGSTARHLIGAGYHAFSASLVGLMKG